jgi:hypothetical protein
MGSEPDNREVVFSMPTDPALCAPEEAPRKNFNDEAVVPFGVTVDHIRAFLFLPSFTPE